MVAYFKDLRSGVVLRFNGTYDITEMRKQISDYVETTEEDYNQYNGIEVKQTKTLTLPKK